MTTGHALRHLAARAQRLHSTCTAPAHQKAAHQHCAPPVHTARYAQVAQVALYCFSTKGLPQHPTAPKTHACGTVPSTCGRRLRGAAPAGAATPHHPLAAACCLAACQWALLPPAWRLERQPGAAPAGPKPGRLLGRLAPRLLAGRLQLGPPLQRTAHQLVQLLPHQMAASVGWPGCRAAARARLRLELELRRGQAERCPLQGRPAKQMLTGPPRLPRLPRPPCRRRRCRRPWCRPCRRRHRRRRRRWRCYPR